MKYFGQGDNYINAECEVCGKVLKISKSICKEENNKYTITESIKCPCGNESAEIIKPESKPVASPKKKGFWGKLFDAAMEMEDAKERKAQEPIRCPKCGSTQITADKKGFGIGKAIAGDLVAGAVGGLVAGSMGKDKVIITCLNCGHKWKAGKRK